MYLQKPLLGPELIYSGLESCPDVPVRADHSNGMPSPTYAWRMLDQTPGEMLLSRGVPGMKGGG